MKKKRISMILCVALLFSLVSLASMEKAFASEGAWVLKETLYGVGAEWQESPRGEHRYNVGNGNGVLIQESNRHEIEEHSPGITHNHPDRHMHVIYAWTTPPEVLQADQKVSIEVKQEVRANETGGLWINFHAIARRALSGGHFEIEGHPGKTSLRLGQYQSAKNDELWVQGSTSVTFSGTVWSALPEGTERILQVQTGPGRMGLSRVRYVYEWQESAAPEPTPTPAPEPAPTSEPTPSSTSDENNLIFDNNNIAGVLNGPSNPTQFTIQQPHQITKIETYHWNNQRGAPAGRIGLQHTDGTIYGPWTATARTGYMNTPNAYWFVEPNATIKAGTYTVIDSDPASWSHNSQSNNEGFARVWGNATDAPAPAPQPEPEPTPTPAPPATTGQAMEATNAGNRMEWPTVRGALGYRIFRSTDPSKLGESVTDFFIEELPFIDVNIQPNTDYHYTVKPVLREANPLQDIQEELGEAIATYTVRSSSNIISSTQQRSFIVLTIDKPHMIVNGVAEEIDPGRGTVPRITSGRTMVPIRAIVEAMGGTVGWDGNESKITLNARGNQVEMWLNRNDIRTNGSMSRMDVAPVSIGGRTFVPLRFSTDNLDARAEWINSTREVVIIY